ncbi:MAG: PIG-L family deacetylase [Desulfobacteraceae bacterium]|nr:PIG-L family deacetylase [Desulfobacteraceae bacterium]
MKVLVIAAHPDDEVLGCGGTIKRLAQEGHAITIAILGEGITSRHRTRNEADGNLVSQLEQCSHRVGKFLDARRVLTRGIPDNRFDSLPLLEVVKIVEEIIEEINPEVIFTHHGGDLNIDHMVVHRAVLTASRCLPDQIIQSVYTFEVPSSTEWAFQQFAPVFSPNFFIDITETMEDKVRAMSMYESEERAFPHPRSPQSLEAIAKRWGSVVGCNRAEAFQMVRRVCHIREKCL